MALLNGPTEPTIDQLCMLPADEQPLRQREFDELFAVAVYGVVRESATTLDLLIDVEHDEVARDLAVRETDCCSFFEFAFRASSQADREWMRIAVDGRYVGILDAVATQATAAAASNLSTQAGQ